MQSRPARGNSAAALAGRRTRGKGKTGRHPDRGGSPGRGSGSSCPHAPAGARRQRRGREQRQARTARIARAGQATRRPPIGRPAREDWARSAPAAAGQLQGHQPAAGGVGAAVARASARHAQDDIEGAPGARSAPAAHGPPTWPSTRPPSGGARRSAEGVRKLLKIQSILKIKFDGKCKHQRRRQQGGGACLRGLGEPDQLQARSREGDRAAGQHQVRASWPAAGQRIEAASTLRPRPARGRRARARRASISKRPAEAVGEGWAQACAAAGGRRVGRPAPKRAARATAMDAARRGETAQPARCAAPQAVCRRAGTAALFPAHRAY